MKGSAERHWKWRILALDIDYRKPISRVQA
jgi:hypothetical protein